MVREVQAASRRLPSGIALRVADYEDASALKRALAGIDDMVLISSDGDASAVMRHHANAIEAATATNIRHITFTSIVDTSRLRVAASLPAKSNFWKITNGIAVESRCGAGRLASGRIEPSWRCAG
jgi:uncharacterized protein YbjT (DUF2867 family)